MDTPIEAQGELTRTTADMLAAALEEERAKVAALVADKAALEGQLSRERERAEAAERERDRERARAEAVEAALDRTEAFVVDMVQTAGIPP